MVIYIVTQGNYSDYSIDSVYDNKKAAESRAFNISTVWDEGRVEEYVLNSTCEKMQPYWYGIMHKDGSLDGYHGKASSDDTQHIRFYPERESLSRKGQTEGAYLAYCICADTELKAIKIANEHRAGLIGSGSWENICCLGTPTEHGYYEL